MVRLMSHMSTAYLLFALLLPLGLQAQLASPGKLSNAHRTLEGVNKCSSCHNFGEKSFRENCLDCHREIKTRVLAKNGYHYYTRKLECSKCHKEHHGRTFELIRWKPEDFDHKQTGFLLAGKHEGLQCRKCHRRENIQDADIQKKGASVLQRTFLGLSAECSACHEDEHRGQMKACASCHTAGNWNKTRFAHGKTRFALQGKHASVSCTGCHPEEDDGSLRHGDTKFLRFSNIAHRSCTDCHEDRHKGAYGTDCTQCHSPAGWQKLRIAEGSFDHSKTEYPLQGRHAVVKCSVCHTNGNFRKFENTDLAHCTSCHEDYHAGQFATRSGGGDCEQCHTVDGFSPSMFEPQAHRSTRFPLEGAHEAIPCIRCHVEDSIAGKTTRRFTWPNLACDICHSDPHAGQFDQHISEDGCTACHDVTSWHIMQFDHSRTRFPLVGTHKRVLCDKCHIDGSIDGVQTRIYRFNDVSCQACHADKHAGQFTDEIGMVDCSRCHQPYRWKDLPLDHAAMARFALTGRHAELPCGRCHRSIEMDGKSVVQYRNMDTKCSSCHATGR
jgi:hypothetical protein